MAGEQLYCT